MREAWHLAAQRPAGHLVVERCFRCGHGIIAAAVGEVGNRLDDQLVGAGDQFLKRDAGLVSDQLCGILGAEIPPDCLDACAGAASADDAGECSARFGIAVASIGGQGRTRTVL